MNIKEKLSYIKTRLKTRLILKKLLKSKPICFVRRVCTWCNANPFPIQVLCILLYRLLLDILYMGLLSPLYSYARMTTDVIPLQYACSWMIVLVFTPIVTQLNRERDASSIMLTAINYLYFIPLTAYCGCKGADFKLLAVACVYWGLLLFWQFFLPRPFLASLSIRHSRSIFSTLTVLSVLVVVYVSARYTGFRFTLNFIDVYDIRFESMAYEMPALLSYALSSMTVVLSILLVYWLGRKKYLLFLFLLFIYLLYFSIGAHKAVFFTLLLVLGCLYFYRDWMRQWVSGVFGLATLAAMLEKKLLGTFYLLFLGFYRMMFLPGQLAEESMAYFQENPLNLFRDGIMGKFSFASVYSTAIQYVMGEQSCYPESFANSGLLSDMFINLPTILGLLLMPLILVLCFRLLDMTSRRVPHRITVAFCIFFSNSFINMSWSTVLLTGGYLLTCVLLYIFPKEEGLPS